MSIADNATAGDCGFLSLQHKEALEQICEKLGQSESEILRVVFPEYAKSISLITEKVHEKT
jgi:hypothetical protein